MLKDFIVGRMDLTLQPATPRKLIIMRSTDNVSMSDRQNTVLFSGVLIL